MSSKNEKKANSNGREPEGLSVGGSKEGDSTKEGGEYLYCGGGRKSNVRDGLS